MSDNGLYTEPVLAVEPGRHTAPIRRLDSDEQGRLLVTASQDKTVRVWAVADGRLLRTLRLPTGPGNIGKAHAVAISPDGMLVAAGGSIFSSETNRSIFIFDRVSGLLQRQVDGLPGDAYDLAFSPNGNRLAAAFAEGGVCLIDLITNILTAFDANYGGRSNGVVFDKAGQLATTCFDGIIRLYDSELNLLRKVKTPGGEKPFSLAFSPDGQRLAVVYNDSTAIDLLDGTTLQHLLAVDTRGINNGNFHGVAWSAGGDSLYAGGQWQVGGMACLCCWPDSGRGSPRWRMLSRNTVMSLRSLPNGELAFATADPQLGLLDRDGNVAWSINPAIVDFRMQEDVFAVSADGTQVGFGYEEWGKVPALFSLPERRVIMGGSVEGFATAKLVAPDLQIESNEDGSRISLNRQPLALKRYERASSFAITPDEQSFVLGSEWSLRLYDRSGQERWPKPRTAPSVVNAITISSNSQLLVAAYGDGTIRWHRLVDGEELLAFYPDSDQERWVVWAQQGYYTASPGGEDLIGWHINRGRGKAPEFYSASRFREQFHRPDVIDLVLKELDVSKAVAKANALRRPERTVETGLIHPATSVDTLKLVSALLPPTISIASPEDGSPIEGNEAILSFQADAVDPVRSVMVLVNGRLALRQPRLEAVVGQISGQLLVPMPPGESIVSLIAENVHGASDPATIRLLGRTCVTTDAVSKPTLHLIAVGVSHYRHQEHLRLKYAAKDAADLAERLLLEKGGLYVDALVWPLRDDEADKRSILRTFRDVHRGLKPNDLVVVFLSGHGAHEGGKYYYLPSDAEADNADAIADTGLNHHELRDAFRRFFDAKAKVIALIDTCYSGDVVEGKALPPDVDIVAQELVQAENGVVVLTSSTGKQVSRERDDLQNGIFTSALLEALRGDADANGDGYISLAELRAFLPPRVADLSGNRQHPTARVPFEKDWEARIALVR